MAKRNKDFHVGELYSEDLKAILYILDSEFLEEEHVDAL